MLSAITSAIKFGSPAICRRFAHMLTILKIFIIDNKKANNVQTLLGFTFLAN